jgi:hypothetical protein
MRDLELDGLETRCVCNQRLLDTERDFQRAFVAQALGSRVEVGTRCLRRQVGWSLFDVFGGCHGFRYSTGIDRQRDAWLDTT